MIFVSNVARLSAASRANMLSLYVPIFLSAEPVLHSKIIGSSECLTPYTSVGSIGGVTLVSGILHAISIGTLVQSSSVIL